MRASRSPFERCRLNVPKMKDVIQMELQDSAMTSSLAIWSNGRFKQQQRGNGKKKVGQLLTVVESTSVVQSRPVVQHSTPIVTQCGEQKPV